MYVEDIRVTLVDELDRSIATMARPADTRNVEAIALGIFLRWNERARTYPDTVAHGWYAWNDRGDILAYGGAA